MVSERTDVGNACGVVEEYMLWATRGYGSDRWSCVHIYKLDIIHVYMYTDDEHFLQVSADDERRIASQDDGDYKIGLCGCCCSNLCASPLTQSKCQGGRVLV